jgi:hypothetical protein
MKKLLLHPSSQRTAPIITIRMVKTIRMVITAQITPTTPITPTEMVIIGTITIIADQIATATIKAVKIMVIATIAIPTILAIT